MVSDLNAEASPRLLDDERLAARILEVFPSPTFVVDADMRILFANGQARDLLGHAGMEPLLRRRGGDALHCVNAENAGGCGRQPACENCVVRRAVGRAYAGEGVYREASFMQLRRPGGSFHDVHLLVTTRPVHLGATTYAVLTVEDVTTVSRLRSFLSVCAGCHRIRDAASTWHKLEAYLKAEHDVSVSHGLCPDCASTLYGVEPLCSAE